MQHHAWTVCVCASLLVVLCSAAAIQKPTVAFSNHWNHNEITREIDLRTAQEEVKVNIELQNVGNSASDAYLVAISQDKAQHLSLLRASENKQNLAVTAVEVTGSSAPAGTVFYRVTLAKSVAGGESTNIQLSLVFTHTQIPLPAEIAQDEDQKLIYHDNHYFFSPYATAKQTTTIRLPSDNIESRSTDEKPNNRLGKDRLEYGPYRKIEAFKSSKLHVHYENNIPFITFTNLRRDIEVSHWGNVAAEEHYDLKHTGARLKGSFSRIDYQRARGYSGRASFRTLTAVLPRGATDVYYRDQIGNISTSVLRETSKGVSLDIDPRFPMFGGWKTDFYIGYNLPAQNVLAVDKSNADRHVLTIPFSTPFQDAVVNRLQLRVILPEGANDIQYYAPFSVDDVSTTTYFTYLDAIGRPVLIIEKNNLVSEHNKPIQVVYSFSSSVMMREPFMLITGFLSIFAMAMLYMRIELSVSDDHAGHSGHHGETGIICNEILDLFAQLVDSPAKCTAANLAKLSGFFEQLKKADSTLASRAEKIRKSLTAENLPKLKNDIYSVTEAVF